MRGMHQAKNGPEQVQRTYYERTGERELRYARDRPWWPVRAGGFDRVQHHADHLRLAIAAGPVPCMATARLAPAARCAIR